MTVPMSRPVVPDRDAVVLELLPMARRVAARFARPGLEREDLVQVAAVGLIHAADRFDERRGVPFVAFALLTVQGELRHYVRDASRRLASEGSWSLPTELSREDERLARIEERLAVEDLLQALDARCRRIVVLRFECDLTLREIAGQLGLSEGHVSRLLHRSLRMLGRRLADRASAWPAAQRTQVRA